MDEELLAKLESAGLEFDHAICFDNNPSLQVIYKRYTVANNLISQVNKMDKDRNWPQELGKSPNNTEIISLFVAKTTWYQTYVKILSRLIGYSDMVAWLVEDPDSKPELELWEGVGEGRAQYTIIDLQEWLDLQDKKKSTKVKKTKVTKGGEKGQAKESQVASGSGKGKGKEKAKESGKKSHRKATKG